MTSRQKFQLLFALIFIIYSQSFSQRKVDITKLKSNFVIEDNKKDYYQNIISEIKSTFRTDINKHSVANWKRAFGNSESLFLFDENVITAIKKSLGVPIEENTFCEKINLIA